MRKLLILGLTIAAINVPSMAVAAVDDEAKKLVDQGNAAAALELELKAHNAEPKNVEHLKALTFIYMGQGEPQKALPYAQEAVKLAPKDVGAYYNLAGLYQSMRAFNEAIKEYKVLQTFDDGLVTGGIGESICLMWSGRGPEAVKVLERLSQQKPDSPEVWASLANYYARQGEYQKAEDSANKAIKAKPSVAAYEVVLKLQVHKHDMTGAVETARKILSIAPKSANSYEIASAVAIAAPAAQGTGLAKEMLKQASASMPQNGELFSNIGRRFQLAGYHNVDQRHRQNAPNVWFGLAEQAYRQAVAAQPKEATYRLQLASVLAGEDNVSEAMKQTKEARRLEPNNRAAADAEAKLRVAENDLARSLKNWLRAYKPLP
jgi:tetratricopeptide (TPR) repeat protein